MLVLLFVAELEDRSPLLFDHRIIHPASQNQYLLHQAVRIVES
jgi:hypothetical protein